MTQYEIQNAIFAIDGYYVPRAGEPSSSAFQRAKVEAEKNLKDRLSHIEAISFGRWETACDHAPPEPKPLQAELAKLARLDWRPVADGLPMADDADACGDVEWSDGRDIWQGFWGSPKAQATHWRPIYLPPIIKAPEPQFKCTVCGRVSPIPRVDDNYTHPCRCADMCCDGPAIPLP